MDDLGQNRVDDDVFKGTLRVAVPIVAPLHDVAEHIEQAQFVGEQAATGMGVIVGVVHIPLIILEQ